MALPTKAPLPAERIVVFDLLAETVGREVDVPVALVTLVAATEQVFPRPWGWLTVGVGTRDADLPLVLPARREFRCSSGGGERP